MRRACQEATARTRQHGSHNGPVWAGEEAMTPIVRLWRAVLLGLGLVLPLASAAQSRPLHQLVVVGMVAGAGALYGVLTVTGVALTETEQLLMTGTLVGTAGPQVIQETWTARAVQFRQEEEAGVCMQLALELAPLTLAGRGRTVEVAPLTLDLTAPRGPDAVLGHLLCVLTYFLDHPSEHGSVLQFLLRTINSRLLPNAAAH